MTTLVQEATQQTGSAIIVPSIFTTAFDTFHKIHQIWRWNRRFNQVTSSSSSFKMLTAGYATQIAAGGNPLVQVAARTTLIATRIIQSAQAKLTFYRSSLRWVDGLMGRHTTYLSLRDPCDYRLSRVLSPSLVRWLDFKMQRSLQYLGNLLRLSFLLAEDAFTLSMSLMDLTLALSFSRDSQDEAVQEIYLNVTEVMEKLIENKPLLLKYLDDNRPMIEKVLTEYKSSYSFDELHQAVAQGIDGTASTYEGIKKGASSVEDYAKNGAYALCLNLLGSAPAFFLPRQALKQKINNSIPRSDYGNDRNHHAAR